MIKETCNKCGNEVIEDRKLDNTIWRCPNCGLEEYLSIEDKDGREEYLCDFIRNNCKNVTKLSGSFLADGERVQFVVDNNLNLRIINYRGFEEYIIKARYRMLSLAPSTSISKFNSRLEKILSSIISNDLKTKIEYIQFEVSVIYLLIQLFSNAEDEFGSNEEILPSVGSTKPLNKDGSVCEIISNADLLHAPILDSNEEILPNEGNIMPLNKDGSVYAIISNRCIEIRGEGKFEGSMWWETKISVGDNTLALVIREGVQFPDNSKYLFDGYNGIIDIYPDIDVSNIISAECMFANTEKANPNTANWELPRYCNTRDMFLNAKAYTGKQFD